MNETTILATIEDKLELASLPQDVQDKYLTLAQRLRGSSDAFEGEGDTWRPSRIRLVQAMTGEDSGKPEDARLGDYFYEGGPIERPTKFVVVYGYYTRVRFVPDEDQYPSCSSENVDVRGRKEKDKSISIYGDKCAECPLDNQPFRYGKPTNCNNVLNVVMLPENLEQILVYQFQKSSWTVGQSLRSLASATHPKPWSRYFSLDSELKKRGKGGGQYAVPVIRPVDTKTTPVPDHFQAFSAFLCDHLKEYRAERKQFRMERAKEIDETINMDTLEDENSDDFSDGM